jgi:hypothetical protein
MNSTPRGENGKLGRNKPRISVKMKESASNAHIVSAATPREVFESGRVSCSLTCRANWSGGRVNHCSPRRFCWGAPKVTVARLFGSV